jgi:hypothetical protein
MTYTMTVTEAGSRLPRERMSRLGRTIALVLAAESVRAYLGKDWYVQILDENGALRVNYDCIDGEQTYNTL